MPDTSAQARVRAELILARERAGLSQTVLAGRLEWTQTKVTRTETGGRRITTADVQAWMRATGADHDTTTKALRLLEDATVQAVTWGRLYEDAGEAGARQLDYEALERAATRVVVFQPAIVPGLAQTPEYMRRTLELFGLPPERIPALTAGRLSRQRILYEPGRDATLLATEAALRLQIAPVGVLHEQLDRMVALSELPSVTVGVIALGSPAPALPLTGYELILGGEQGDHVIVETLHRELTMTSDEDVARYVTDLKAWLKVAAVGEAARTELARIRADLTA